MRMFLAGLVTAVIIAVATGIALDQLQLGADRFSVTDHVRL